nr:mucin-5AC-like [Lytechinus pictus]
MRVVIGIAALVLIILYLFLLVLPFTLTVFFVITVGSFIAFHLSQNPVCASRILSHVRTLSTTAPKFWRTRPEEEATTSRASEKSLSPAYQPKLTDSIKERGKENIVNYVRPTLKPRRFRTAVETSEFQGKSPHQTQQNWVPLKNSTAANFSTWSPRQATEGFNFSTGYSADDKFSFSRLPLSPIYPPNKSVDSPELDSSTTMLRFNSGQDSLLHPSMHYPTHQPDLVTSPGLLPSVNWLKDGGMSSPRQRKGLPRVQTPVMVKIACPLPDRPASPLFRKLASESDKQKSSSADKVIMAIRQRQKRTVHDANSETNSPIAPSDVRSESKRRKLESTSSKDTGRSDMDIDLDINPLPRRKQTDRIFRPSRFGITSPTPRNPIVSSFSSSKKTQATLKRRIDTSSVEVEEEEGVSPIKKKAHPQTSQQSPRLQSPSKRINPPSTPGLLAGRSGIRALFLEKNTGLSESPSKDAGTTPQKSNLKGKLFTPKRTSFVPRVDTPGEYTAADTKEDRAQARQRGSYLKEMLMQETEENPSKGADSTGSAQETNTLFTGTTATAASSNPLPTLSIGSLTKSTASTTSAAPAALSTITSISSGGTSALGILSTSTQNTSSNPLLSTSDKQKLTATSSEKTISFGNPTAQQLNLSSSASASSAGTSQKSGEASVGFKLPSATSAGISLGTQPSLSLGANPVCLGLSSALGGTQVDAKAPSLSTNNNAVAAPSEVKTTQPQTTSASISGGFTVGGAATMFSGPLTTSAPATSTSTSTTSTKPQFPSIFGGLGASSGAQGSAGSTPGKPSSQAPAGGFQFGQTTIGSTPTTSGGLSFGNSKTSSVPSGLATPFQAAAQTSAPASTVNKSMFSMSAPNTTAPSATQNGGPQFPPIFGKQTTATTSKASGIGQGALFGSTTSKPSVGATGISQGTPFGSTMSQPSVGATGISQGTPTFGSATSQPPTGGFKFGQSVNSAPATAPPPAFNFGGSSAAQTSSSTSSSSMFGSAPAPSFGVSKPGSGVGSSIFGAAPATNQTPLGSAPANASTMFSGATTTPQKPAFGATSNSSMFGNSAGAPASKPAFGNPTATVTPFGSGTSQPPAATSSPFQFGSSQPKAPTQPPTATGGFNFGGQATPQKSFNFGGSAPAPTPNSGFQFGQGQPSGGATPQTNFFGGASGNAASPFGGGGGFGAPTPGAGNTPAPAFGASPSPAPAPAAGGFSIGSGGANPAASQKRANRLRQLRSRAGRR